MSEGCDACFDPGCKDENIFSEVPADLFYPVYVIGLEKASQASLGRMDFPPSAGPRPPEHLPQASFDGPVADPVSRPEQ